MSRPVSKVLEAVARAKKQSHAQYFAVMQLESAWNSRDNMPESFYDFIPIKLVTLIESQARHVIAEAINFSDPFTGNAIKLIDKWSASQVLEALIAITKGKITIGELAAHSFTVGSFK